MYGYAMQTNWEWELGQDKGKTTILNSYRWRHYMKHLKFQVLPSPLTRTSQHQVNVEGQWECDDQSNHFKFNQKQRATSEAYWGRCCEVYIWFENSIQMQTLIGFMMNNKLLMKCDQDDLGSMMKYFTVCTLFYWSNSSPLPLLSLVCFVFNFSPHRSYETVLTFLIFYLSLYAVVDSE